MREALFNPIFGYRAFHALLYEICFVAFAAQLRLSVAFANTYIRTLQYFSGTDKDRADITDAITLRYRFLCSGSN